ncbi:hypothetical protein PVAND_002420 [Polypedilum vanderplanki]|uniref:Mannosyltransferase n=1 Tax=Polypedilum vanderplanki TaxID=319348 RepID=A0A9J6BS41_POLVA|nr:hypothetical protein PVAND_002420 [Polypedilum vanderplanki]
MKRKESLKLGKSGTSSSFRRRSSSYPNAAVSVRPPLFPTLQIAFKALLSARICAAIWSSISDCDETYNYWEELHYLLYNKGLQTWEYSPQFALRSYTYLLVHGVPAYIYKEIFDPNPMLLFYFIRLLLGISCAVAEVYFYKGICREFGVHIGRSWLVFQLFSAGMFISSAALLPSSFSMYFTMAALAAWWHQQYKLAIFFTAISVLLGWPFVGLISLPILYDIIIRRKKIRTFIFWSIISGVTVLLPMIILDSSYYGRNVIAPLNIVFYNIFKKDGGPNLYGTEPFSYYIFNGFLNFNIIWLLSLMTPVALVIAHFLVPSKSKQSTLSLPYYVSLSPYYLWLAVMMAQPHKEERFLFPVYPLVSLCGAITIDVCQKLFFRIKSAIVKFTTATHYLNHTTFITVIFVILSVTLNLSRILALYQNYHAPMDVFMELSTAREDLEDPHSQKMDVCIGKDWYRYPSSFFLPSTKYSIRFLKSEFRGMLPAYYSDEENATQIIHNYFNDMNRENAFMYFDYNDCDLLVDLDLKTKKHSPLEPNYSSRTDEWNVVKEVPFLNAQASHPIYRAFYIPFVSYKHIKYGSFNLLQKIKDSSETVESDVVETNN